MNCFLSDKYPIDVRKVRQHFDLVLGVGVWDFQADRGLSGRFGTQQLRKEISKALHIGIRQR